VFRVSLCLVVPWEGCGDEAGPGPSQAAMSVGEDRAGGRRWSADKLTSATQVAWGLGQVAPKAGASGPPCCPFPPQLFDTKGLVSDSVHTLYSRGDKIRYFTQKC